MNDDQRDPVGSLAEELAKLMGMMPAWPDTSARSGGAAQDDSAPGPHEHGHIADGSSSCQICPVCQTISFVRSASPEVREHLAASATAFVSAARGLVDAVAAYQHQQQPPGDAGGRDAGVENIDLSEDDSWD